MLLPFFSIQTFPPNPPWERAQAWVTTTLLLLLLPPYKWLCPWDGGDGRCCYWSLVRIANDTELVIVGDYRRDVMKVMGGKGRVVPNANHVPAGLQTFVVIRKRYKDSTNHFRVSTKRSVYVADFPNDGTLNREKRREIRLDLVVQVMNSSHHQLGIQLSWVNVGLGDKNETLSDLTETFTIYGAWMHKHNSLS